MRGVLQFKKNSFVEMQDIFEKLSQGQNPETLFITCSDSRIIPSLITGSKPGALFSIRNIGPIIPPYPSLFSEAAALEYALSTFNIKDIIICGHSQCGAMKGLLTEGLAETLPSVALWLGNAEAVLDEMRHDHSEHTADPQLKLSIATKKNIVLQMEHLKSYPMVAKKLANKELTIHGWLYEFETGKIFIHEPHLNEFVQLEESDSLKFAIEERKNNIINRVAMNYLKTLSDPQSIIASLDTDIKAIWKKIKRTSKQEIWAELGEFYKNRFDKKFIELVESGSMIKLKHLDELQTNRSKLQGASKEKQPSFFSNSQPLGQPLRQGLRKRKNDSNESSEEKRQTVCQTSK